MISFDRRTLTRLTKPVNPLAALLVLACAWLAAQRVPSLPPPQEEYLPAPAGAEQPGRMALLLPQSARKTASDLAPVSWNLYPPYGEYPYVNPPFGDYPFYGPWPASDRDMERNIWHELLGDRLLDSFGIRVRVSEGVAILTGSVKFWADFYRADDDARAAGARGVLNQLRVRYN